ncbi:MAG: hypothetical protein KGJ37_01590 [Verrucomicrobiota bacterium]|nr:hypothetical protein [Verrucomicrobiota bacterium]
MRWLLDNPQVLIVVAIVVASLMRKLKKQRLQSEARQVIDADEAERTRRLQEEIRRKIAERTGRALPQNPPAVQPPVISRREAPLPPTTFAPQPSPRRNIFEELARQLAETQASAAARERERTAAEEEARGRAVAEQKARELAEAERRMAARAYAVRMAASKTTEQPQTVLSTEIRGKLLADLREPVSLRRAFVLCEVLGAPVGLR